MCGIAGYIGEDAIEKTIRGLESLEYRGYDSAGIAWFDKGKICEEKSVGKVAVLKDKLKASSANTNIAIGHTRWATHGSPSTLNAHPHSIGSFTIVHNGIIENYKDFKPEYMVSDTDSEIIAYLLFREEGSVIDKIFSIMKKIKGSYAVVFIYKDDPGAIYAFKKDSPLIIGNCETGAAIASDVDALIGHCNTAVALENYHVAKITDGEVQIYNDYNSLEPEEINIAKLNDVSIKEDDTYMMKEIMEQPAVVQKTLKLNKNAGLNDPDIHLDNMVFSACGTSAHACEIAQYCYEDFGKIVGLKASSELRHRSVPLEYAESLLLVSQSGETADTIAVARKAHDMGIYVTSIVNRPNSTLARESDKTFLVHAGPEISVASTKAFSGQLALLYRLISNEMPSPISELNDVPEIISNVLLRKEKIKDIADKIVQDCKLNSSIYIGRGYGYPVAKEGALKLKEISYIHAEAYCAGELKHGPIALLEKDFLVVAIANKSTVYDKVASNIEEARARGAKIFSIVTEGDQDVSKISDYFFEIPHTSEKISPFPAVVSLQLFSYYMAKAMGKDIDMPRNLAKSVTVE